MKNSYKTFASCLLAVLALPVMGQTVKVPLKLQTAENYAQKVVVSKDTVKTVYDAGMAQFSVLTNKGYKAAVAAGSEKMVEIVGQNPDQVLLFVHYNQSVDPRTGKITLTSTDGKVTRDVVVSQSGNNSATTVQGDIKLKIASGVANQSQPGEDISKSFDGNMNTLYHSPYGGGTHFPVVLTYNLEKASHVDYVTYHPRVSGGSNGNFGQVKVYYATADAPQDFKLLEERDLGGSGASSQFELGDAGMDNIKSIRFEVLSGTAGFASCAEMEIYQRNHEMDALFAKYFQDKLCTRLKPEVTEDVAAAIEHPYVKQLVYNLLSDPTYAQSKYRIGTFEAYEPVWDLANRLKTSAYNQYENPTGIYFEEGKPIVVFVDGMGKDKASLIIKNFGRAYQGEPQSESSYPLKNGVNVIVPKNRGNGYISYYTKNYAQAPEIKMHFAMAVENGYFDLERGDTNEDWKELLAHAKSDIIDLRTKRVQVAYPTARFKQYCPENARELALLADSTVYYEREILGLSRYGREPKNRQFARVIWGGGMFADGVGAAADDGALEGWIRPFVTGKNQFQPWGFGHELGHVNQVRPGLKWVGCGETTNNIYSAWVEHKIGNGYHRLESEASGTEDYNWMKGGRFNVYLEENVRKGVSWQLADGADYHGSKPNQKTVKNQDYEGHVLNQDTTVLTRNYDHFVKLVPFWQLQLYCNEVALYPQAKDVFAKVIEALRKESDKNMSNGMHQMRFMKLVCDSTQLNFLPFFEKAGMLRPINAYIEDYAPDWLKINQPMIDELKKYVAGKGYPVPGEKDHPDEVNYISARNWHIYRDRLPLADAAVGAGCSPVDNGARIKVMHNVWQNAVAFETYDAEGNLLRISMGGLGEDSDTAYNFTRVLWPQTEKEKAAYIMAVGYDGTRKVCYGQKPE